MTAEAPKTPWTPGDEIRKARKDAHLEQDELAALVQVSRKTISMWENGHTEPTISQWRAIAHATDAPWLLTGSGRLLTYADGIGIVDEVNQPFPNFEYPPATKTADLSLVS